MMNDRHADRQPEPPAGLCETCGQARLVTSDRGSRFIRCARAEVDPRFPKYPALPVVRCGGYERLS
jgi:hypothetical protein